MKELQKTRPEPKFEELPNFYGETLQVAAYSELTDEEITAKANEYNRYNTMDLMPNAKREIGKVLTHLAFEAAWRLGVFNRKDIDE